MKCTTALQQGDVMSLTALCEGEPRVRTKPPGLAIEGTGWLETDTGIRIGEGGLRVKARAKVGGGPQIGHVRLGCFGK